MQPDALQGLTETLYWKGNEFYVQTTMFFGVCFVLGMEDDMETTTFLRAYLI